MSERPTIPTHPPELPPHMAGRSCNIAVRGDGGVWWIWGFIWGHYDGEPPCLAGTSRAEALDTVRALGDERPTWVQP